MVTVNLRFPRNFETVLRRTLYCYYIEKPYGGGTGVYFIILCISCQVRSIDGDVIFCRCPRVQQASRTSSSTSRAQNPQLHTVWFPVLSASWLPRQFFLSDGCGLWGDAREGRKERNKEDLYALTRWCQLLYML